MPNIFPGLKLVETQDASPTERSQIPPPILHTKWGLFPITTLVLSLAFLLSSIIPVEKDVAEEMIASLESVNFNQLDIFISNLILSVVMMIPALGFVFSLLSSSLEGMVVSAFSILNNSNPLSIAVSFISTPEGMLEFLAYGLASAQGLAGFFAIVEKRFRRELKEYLTTLLIVIGLLIAAALLEAARKTSLSS
jgi:uncharacterized membrane protein SpoIIM required for sporulation